MIDLRRSTGLIYEGVLDKFMKEYLIESKDLTVKAEKVHTLGLWNVFQKLYNIRFPPGR